MSPASQGDHRLDHLPADTIPDHGGEFLFHPRMHEPGPQTVLGKTYRDTGVEQGRAVLADLARHPATAMHVATKLARHFVADDPPPALVETLRAKFIETDGDLWEVSKALVTAPESWSREQAKLKRPANGLWPICGPPALPATSPPHDPGDEQARRTAVAAAGAEGIFRPERSWLDGLGQRLDIANNRPDSTPIASTRRRCWKPRSVRSHPPRPAPPCARRDQAAGARAPADVPRIPTEVTMSDVVPIPLHAATRRELLLGSGALFAWAFVPRIARAEGRDPRFLAIVLRGALDGLAAVAPVGDPDWIKLRGDNALKLDGDTPALPLDGFFALNPAMPNLHRLYEAGQAIVVHAVATPYRERSHFDGQDVLESGLPRPGRADTGWLNRALARLEPDARVAAAQKAGGALRSAPSPRWWCAARRRCCPGCRRGCRR